MNTSCVEEREGQEAFGTAIECRLAQMQTHKELLSLVGRLGGSLKAERFKLYYVRQWWALTAYRLATGKEPFPTSGEVGRFVAKLANVADAEATKVLNGEKHFPPEILDRLEEGIGVYGAFHPATVMGECFEEGIREFDEAREEEDRMRETARGWSL